MISNFFELNVLISGMRALLFMCSLFSAITFVQETRGICTIVCDLYHHRLRSKQIVGVAAFGWCVAAVSCMIMTFNRLQLALFSGLAATNPYKDWDGVFICVGLFGLACGMYIPVFAVLWYRRKLATGLFLGGFAWVMALFFMAVATHLPLGRTYLPFAF